MAKKTTPEVKEEKKVITKYDRKMAARRAKEEKDKRDDKIFRVVSSLIGIVIVLAIVIGVASSIINKQTALRGTYIQVGNRNVSRLEFDYYYNASVNNYLSTYGSLVYYMGLDTTQDFADQVYDEENDLSWKDYFDQLAVQQITQTYALTEDAKANGFSYDDTADYEECVLAYQEAASTAGITESEYYKNSFGQYATKSNVESFIKDGLLAAAYYDDLTEQNAPSAEEIVSYYEENARDYDEVDYRSFVFTADVEEDASDEDVEKAMSELKEKAEAFKAARLNGSEFEALCIENASEEDKANYEDADTEYCLSEGQYYAYIPSAINSWLYDDARQEGDVEVIEDSDYQRYYVVEFISKYYDAEESDAAISDLLASDAVVEYVSNLIENYQVTDTKGKLKYLAVDTSEEESDAAEASTEGDEAESTDTDNTDEIPAGETTENNQ